jgi:hypothetical protein
VKTEVSIPASTVSRALTKGTCPICSILKDFQWALAETTEPEANLRLCNFHVWALARSRDKLSRSTPGETVTARLLGDIEWSTQAGGIRGGVAEFLVGQRGL